MNEMNGEALEGEIIDVPTTHTGVAILPPHEDNGQRKYDWDLVKDIYVQGLIDEGTGERRYHESMKDLSRYTGVPYAKLRERKAKQHWDDERSAFQAQKMKLDSEHRAAHLVGEMVDFDSKALAGSKVGIMLVQARLAEMAEQLKAERYRVSEGSSQTLEMIGSGWIDSSELTQLSRAMAQFQDIGRKCLGDVEEIASMPSVGMNTVIDIREELTYADDERIARSLQLLDGAGLLDAAIAGDRDQETDDAPVASG